MGVGSVGGVAQHSLNEEQFVQFGSPESRGFGLAARRQPREGKYSGHPCHRVSLDSGLDDGSPSLIGPAESHGLNGTGSSVSEHARACKSLEGKDDLNPTRPNWD